PTPARLGSHCRERDCSTPTSLTTGTFVRGTSMDYGDHGAIPGRSRRVVQRRQWTLLLNLIARAAAGCCGGGPTPRAGERRHIESMQAMKKDFPRVTSRTR